MDEYNEIEIILISTSAEPSSQNEYDRSEKVLKIRHHIINITLYTYHDKIAKRAPLTSDPSINDSTVRRHNSTSTFRAKLIPNDSHSHIIASFNKSQQ